MYAILGGTGHVGGAAAAKLLDAGEPVTIVTRDRRKTDRWEARGAAIAIVDVLDVTRLREVFRSSKGAFLLNPPADPHTDTDAEERRTAAALVAAIEGSGLERVVVASTYGAQPGQRCGDLTTLYELEAGVEASGIPAVINRGAYYFSNWDYSLEQARSDGVIESMIPADFLLPMVAPTDLGRAAARRLTEPFPAIGIHHVEGPQRHTPSDVAAAFARHLDRPVTIAEIPREQLRSAYEDMGFSTAAADSYTRMTEVMLDRAYEMPENPERGVITLDDHIAELVSDHANPSSR